MKTNNSLKKFAKGQSVEKSKKSQQNCVIYTRVSSKEQADTNKSLEWQLNHCKEYANKHSLNILGYFGGTYESAKSDERKEFQKMLQFLPSSKEKISRILVYSLDRFSRTGDEAILIIRELKKVGIEITAVSQPIDTDTHAGVLQQNIQLIFSQYDNDLRRQKSIDGMRAKLLRGERMGACPKGYSFDRTNGGRDQKIIINDDGKHIRLAFEWRSQGITGKIIIERLKELGLKIPNQTLSDIFRNPFYCGFIAHNFLGGELVKGKHPALVSEDLFIKVNQLKQKEGIKINIINENLPLKNFVKDANTNVPFTGYLVKKKNLYYYKVNRIGVKVNRNVNILHNKFKELLNSFKVGDKYFEALKIQLLCVFENLNESNVDHKKSLSIRLNKVQEDMRTLEKRYAFEGLKTEIFEKYFSELQEDEIRLSLELEKLNQKISNPKELIDFTLDLSSKLALVWEKSNYYQKQNLQNMLFPIGLAYDAKIDNYRTPVSNAVFTAIAYISSELENKKSGTSLDSKEKSRLVPRVGIEPTHLTVHDFESCASTSSAI
jgi:site-specific DNA recombinase